MLLASYSAGKRTTSSPSSSRGSFHVLPLAMSAPSSANAKGQFQTFLPPSESMKSHQRLTNRKAILPTPKAKVRANRKRRAEGQMSLCDLVGKSLETSDGRRICWRYNMSNGCNDAAPGAQCQRGVHVCAEPGCGKPHSLLAHKQS